MRLLFSFALLIACWMGAAPCAWAAVRAAVNPGAERRASPDVAPERGAFLRHLTQTIAFDAGLAGADAVLRSADGDTDGDDDTVVQDEAPAARTDAGDGVTPALVPLGTLSPSPCSLPTHRILPRRSPRGPPVF